jgi:hypothetical protein
MMSNPLIEAIRIYEDLLDSHLSLVEALGYDASGPPPAEATKILNDVQLLVVDSAAAVSGLSGRARRARLNLLWRDFEAANRIDEKETKR